MTRTESLFRETINDFCNKIGTLRKGQDVSLATALGRQANSRITF
jgi:hypothetical protein